MAQFLTKYGTISASADAHRIRPIHYDLPHFITVMVEPKCAKDLPKLVEGLKRLSKTDLLFKSKVNDNGAYSLYGTSERHLKESIIALESTFE